jgi:diacylglycerol kinase (ATP)
MLVNQILFRLSMEPNYSIENNPHKGNKGLARAIRAAVNSWNGLKYAYKEESAFRQELFLAVILIPIAIYIPCTIIEKILLVSSVFLVLIVELLNSSVEAAIDRISFDIHGLSKRAKDFGSAAVMVALLLCGFTWVLVLINTYC